MNLNRISPLRPAARLLLHALPAVLASLAGTAHADGDRRAVPLLPAYVQECGSCHVAFAPGLLPAASWQRLMDGLPRHFGTDASAEPAVTRPIAAWLQANAATRKRTEVPPQDRITQAAWFTREHRDVQGGFGRAPVPKAVDCAGCHTRAADGSFREREIRVPR